jgi:hypothetical protein
LAIELSDLRWLARPARDVISLENLPAQAANYRFNMEWIEHFEPTVGERMVGSI